MLATRRICSVRANLDTQRKIKPRGRTEHQNETDGVKIR
jgi:hypothetical protein